MLRWLASDPQTPFPQPSTALHEPNGLLAAGGDLSPQRLLNAYRQGIFPWYSEGQPILWWSPDPRWVLTPATLHVSRSLRKTLRQGRFTARLNYDFAAVLDACAAPRCAQTGTWITPAMRAAYLRLHALGYAHSVEVGAGTALVGGLYGIALGGVFFGESMFSRQDDASKVALVALTRFMTAQNLVLIDCQVESEHLRRLGAGPMPRALFTRQLARLCPQNSLPHAWPPQTLSLD